MKRVTLDPGNGGFNIGFIFEHLIEKEINLNIALKCKEELLRHNVDVEITREDDNYVGYSQRIAKANKNFSDVFISIHCNSGEGSLTELVYSVKEERGLKLATSIGNEIRNYSKGAIKIYNRIGYGYLDFNTVIRETKIDSVIIKCAFLDNENDRNLINTLEKQNEFGTAIAKGILKFFKIDYIQE